ncbi:MAG: hypothetical protein KKF58_05820 [Gammaproteobacteria bacterium]|nr:hypothetical protein [Gammaproteobacteria bacterium]MBU1447809.1 hypothetical protein [Gammaproteobacteria bacterium]
MTKSKVLSATMFTIAIAFYSALSLGEEAKRAWRGSACYQMRLGVWDKLMEGPYLARYVFKTDDGRIFVAERNGDDDSSTADVVFPDDFHEEVIFKGKKVDMPAGHCSQRNYTWYIYANDILFDTGTITFSKKGGEHEGQH